MHLSINCDNAAVPAKNPLPMDRDGGARSTHASSSNDILIIVIREARG